MPYKDVPDEELLSLAEAKTKKGYGGVLRDNVVMVDVDDMDQAELLRKILAAKRIRARITKTSRGMHFTMFCSTALVNNAGLESCIGIVCDYKYGLNPSYEALKTDGRDREVLEDPKTISMMPMWLYPISDKPVSTRQDFVSLVGMGQGEGRNNALFTRACSGLKRSRNGKVHTKFNPMANMARRDYEDMVRIINDYVFAEPLEENEIQTLTSQERFENQAEFAHKNQKRGKSDEVAAAIEDMIEKCSVRQFGSALYRLSGGKRYRILTQKYIDAQLIRVRGISAEKATAASRTIRAYLDEDTENEPYPTWYVGFRNGVINWRTGAFEPYTEDTVVFVYFDVDYLPDVDTSYMKSVLMDWCQGSETQYRMLLEMAGACLYRDRPIKKWWVIEGLADTGKSTFLDLLRSVLGSEMIGSVPVQSMKDSNAIAELLDKTVNIVDDGSANYVYDLSRLRQIIQGTPIQLKLLYQDRFTARLEARMIFVFNEIPRFKDDNGATAKKMMVIRFGRVYSDEEKDIRLLEKLTTEENRSAFVKLAVDAMRDVLARNLTFTVSAESRQIVQELVEQSDQFNSYLAELRNDDGSIDWDEVLGEKDTGTVYEEFRKWALREGYHTPLVQKTFTAKMAKASGTRVRGSNGKRFYRFTDEESAQEVRK
ncbi:MAG: hypothetical protein IIZ55_03035 [Firmicutes bacterium]|nr:hypothetical protein [Bacillota bacterium]